MRSLSISTWRIGRAHRMAVQSYYHQQVASIVPIATSWTQTPSTLSSTTMDPVRTDAEISAK